MVVGILLAGGIGQRMGASVPKQFLTVNGKPIVFYPLEIMERHPQIDAVEVVCVENFIDGMWDIVRQYGFNKVKWITPGGATCQESTWNGLKNLKDKLSDDDIILIHMSSYPLANADIMSGCIESAMENGNGCTARPILYSVYFTDDRKTTTEQIDRDKLMLCTVPYAFRFGECADLYDKAFAEGKGVTGNVFTNTLYCGYGKRVYFTRDSETNMKVTTPETAIANDYGYDDVFARQAEGHCRPGDLFIGISTSGNSENVLRAVKVAKEKWATTAAFLGKDGGKIKDLVDLPVIVKCNNTARVQESHICIIHSICEIVELQLVEEC